MTGAIPEVVFVDTTILVHAHDRRDPVKYEIAKAALAKLWDTGTGALSTQVLQEYYRVATRELGIPHAEARETVSDYGEWCVTLTDAQLLVSASVLHERYRLDWRDSLVVEGALRCGATTLLSEDMQHGQRFDSLTIRNPFVEP